MSHSSPSSSSSTAGRLPVFLLQLAMLAATVQASRYTTLFPEISKINCFGVEIASQNVDDPDDGSTEFDICWIGVITAAVVAIGLYGALPYFPPRDEEPGNGGISLIKRRYDQQAVEEAHKVLQQIERKEQELEEEEHDHQQQDSPRSHRQQQQRTWLPAATDG